MTVSLPAGGFSGSSSLGVLPGERGGREDLAGGVLDCTSGTWALFFVVKLCVLGRWGKRAGPCPALISAQIVQKRMDQWCGRTWAPYQASEQSLLSVPVSVCPQQRSLELSHGFSTQ